MRTADPEHQDRLISGLFGLVVVLTISVPSVAADITGSSRLDVNIDPLPCTLVEEIKLDTPCEKSMITVDIESIISVTIVSNALSLSVDTAVGLAGPEHFIFTGSVTLGDVELTSELWFAVPFESVLDVNNLPNTVLIPPGNVLFVTKRLTTRIPLGDGLTLENLAMFEDITFPEPNASYGETDCDGDDNPEGTCVNGKQTNPATEYVNQWFAFGDVVMLSGQTKGGVSVSSELALCASGSVSVKKFSGSPAVNPDCATEPKPDLLFDHLTFRVNGVKLADRFTASTSATCRQSFKCELTNSVNVSLGSIPTSVSLTFDDLFGLQVGGLSTSLNSGPLSIRFDLLTEHLIDSIGLNFSKTFTSGNLSASLSARTSIVTGTGITGATVNLSATSGIFQANHTLSLRRSSTGEGLTFGSLAISMGLNLSPSRILIRSTFGKKGLSSGGVSVGLFF